MARKPQPGSAETRNRNQYPPIDWGAVMPAICARIIGGESLRRICSDAAMPNKTTVMEHLARDAAAREAYQFARTLQADDIFDEVLEIADDGRNDWMEQHGGTGEAAPAWRANLEHIARSRLRIDTRKWVLARMNPKKYGEHSANHTTPDDHAKQLRELRDLMLNGRPDVDPPEDS